MYWWLVFFFSYYNKNEIQLGNCDCGYGIDTC